MSVARVWAAGLEGICAYPVELEVEATGKGLPCTRVVGLPDAALREARERVKAAVRSSGYSYPGGSVTVNLAPARRRKEEGAAFDLPIALAILAAMDPPVLEPEGLAGVAALGELSLAGATRPVRGALAAGETLARAGVRRLLVPRANARAAALGAGEDVQVLPVTDLAEAVGVLRREVRVPRARVDRQGLVAAPAPEDLLDLVDVRGALGAKRALLVAAAGAHDLLLVGPPGAGKTMLARRLPGLLPPLGVEEMLEVTRIHGAARGEDAGDLQAAGLEGGLVRRRPFRAPHHTASYAALVGGGSSPRPGEVSLAHKGVLFLDELPEFATRALEALREPLESRTIAIARARSSVVFPADFQLVAAMNPCPCGYVNEPRARCLCSPTAVERYQARVSGPLLDRIDLQARLRAVPFEALRAPPPPRDGTQGSAALRARVEDARAAQLERSGCLNARLDARELRRVCAWTPSAERALGRAAEARLLSGRGVAKVQKVALTLADLEGRVRIASDDVSLAVHLRVGERAAA